MSLPKPYYEEPGITIYHADCRDVLPYLPPVDLVFFDPPYGLGIAAWDEALRDLDLIQALKAQIIDSGSLYVTCSFHILGLMIEAIQPRRIISWGKPNLPLRKGLNEWEWSTEFILWWVNGDISHFIKPDGEASRDYWRIPVENGFLNGDGGNHPARKPLKLLRRILGASAQQSILDPFMGSGTTLRAAKDLGLSAIGIEIEEKYCAIAVERLRQEVLPLSSMETTNADRA